MTTDLTTHPTDGRPGSAHRRRIGRVLGLTVAAIAAIALPAGVAGADTPVLRSGGSAAGATTCRGEAADLVVDQGQSVTADPGDRVIVVNGPAEVESWSAEGHVICVTTGPGRGGYHSVITLHGTGDDVVLTGGNPAVVYAGDGDDVILANSPGLFDGEDGDDRIHLAVPGSIAYGGDGRDTLHGSPGSDTLEAGPGDDHVRGWGGADVLTGGDGGDEIHGGAGWDDIAAGTGGETYFHPDLCVEYGGLDGATTSGCEETTVLGQAPGGLAGS